MWSMTSRLPSTARTLRHARESHVCVVFQGLRDRAVGLSQRELVGAGGFRQRLGQGVDEECVGVLVEREGARLAARADDAAGAGREGAEVLPLAAGRAG